MTNDAVDFENDSAAPTPTPTLSDTLMSDRLMADDTAVSGADAHETETADRDRTEGGTEDGTEDGTIDGIGGPFAAGDVERAFGAFHRSVDAFAEQFQAELSTPEALDSYNEEMEALLRFKAPGFDDVMGLTEAANHPAVVRTGRALARRILQLEKEIETLRHGAADTGAAQSRRDLEEEWRDLRNKADYWTDPKVQRRSREIAEALFGTDPVGPGAARTAVGVNSHRTAV